MTTPSPVEALRNAKGLLDTPVSRRRFKGDTFFAETVECINAAVEALRPMETAPKDGTAINLHVSWKIPCFWCPDLKRWVTTHQHTIDSVRDAEGWSSRAAKEPNP